MTHDIMEVADSCSANYTELRCAQLLCKLPVRVKWLSRGLSLPQCFLASDMATVTFLSLSKEWLWCSMLDGAASEGIQKYSSPFLVELHQENLTLTFALVQVLWLTQTDLCALPVCWHSGSRGWSFTFPVYLPSNWEFNNNNNNNSNNNNNHNNNDKSKPGGIEKCE